MKKMPEAERVPATSDVRRFIEFITPRLKERLDITAEAQLVVPPGVDAAAVLPSQARLSTQVVADAAASAALSSVLESAMALGNDDCLNDASDIKADALLVHGFAHGQREAAPGSPSVSARAASSAPGGGTPAQQHQPAIFTGDRTPARPASSAAPPLTPFGAPGASPQLPRESSPLPQRILRDRAKSAHLPRRPDAERGTVATTASFGGAMRYPIGPTAAAAISQVLAVATTPERLQAATPVRPRAQVHSGDTAYSGRISQLFTPPRSARAASAAQDQALAAAPGGSSGGSSRQLAQRNVDPGGFASLTQRHADAVRSGAAFGPIFESPITIRAVPGGSGPPRPAAAQRSVLSRASLCSAAESPVLASMDGPPALSEPVSLAQVAAATATGMRELALPASAAADCVKSPIRAPHGSVGSTSAPTTPVRGSVSDAPQLHTPSQLLLQGGTPLKRRRGSEATQGTLTTLASPISRLGWRSLRGGTSADTESTSDRISFAHDSLLEKSSHGSSGIAALAAAAKLSSPDSKSMSGAPARQIIAQAALRRRAAQLQHSLEVDGSSSDSDAAYDDDLTAQPASSLQRTAGAAWPAPPPVPRVSPSSVQPSKENSAAIHREPFATPALPHSGKRASVTPSPRAAGVLFAVSVRSTRTPLTGSSTRSTGDGRRASYATVPSRLAAGSPGAGPGAAVSLGTIADRPAHSERASATAAATAATAAVATTSSQQMSSIAQGCWTPHTASPHGAGHQTPPHSSARMAPSKLSTWSPSTSLAGVGMGAGADSVWNTPVSFARTPTRAMGRMLGEYNAPFELFASPQRGAHAGNAESTRASAYTSRFSPGRMLAGGYALDLDEDSRLQ